MPIDLSSAWAKVSWAEHHLQTLDAEIRQFLDSQPYEVIEEVDMNARDPFEHPAIDHTFRVRVKRERPPIWEAIIGDCLHNLRCSLDHLAWTLAGSSSGDSTTQFPIFDDLGKYERYAGRQTALIPDEPLAIIKELQPYEASRDDPRANALWMLHDLERIDKHRQLLILNTVTTRHFGAIKEKPADLIMGIDMLAGNTPFQDGAVIARYQLTLDRDETPPNMQAEIKFSFDVAFDPKGPGRGEPVSQGLSKISTHVAQVLKLFGDY